MQTGAGLRSGRKDPACGKGPRTLRPFGRSIRTASSLALGLIRSADPFIDSISVSIGAPSFRIASLNDIEGRPLQRVSPNPCKRTII